MISPLRIGIVGYGTAGQAAALLLSRDGHRVDVFERAPVLGPVGAGFLLQPTGLAVLWALGLLDEALAHGARVARLYGETAQGRAVMDMRYMELAPSLFGLGMQRGALFGLLDMAWQEGRSIHCGLRIVAADVERGVLRDEAGDEHGAFDVLVIADGAASLLRHQVADPWIVRTHGARSGALSPRATGPGWTNCDSATSAQGAWPACCRWGRAPAIRHRG